ncbi:MAG TPA: ABC transporter ATP-binding protein [Sporosarcina psychrophila]|uniref:ABC transporter ATP-binding protein n=1 Tax=Sporosarcina psychrophila TaxID=1476 RepID=A0A921G354_SPOPS|nr:ABC transporter ATP-binding protein [Sporosarcina psychrophila]
MLKLEKLFVRINRKSLLSSINLEIAAGEVVALCGPNGAGKSTIVSAIAGIIQPVSGRILLAGKPLEKKRKSEIGFMFQHAEFIDNVKVKEMLCLFQSFYGDSYSFNELVRMGLLQEMLLKKTNELSGGERKRLSFALAMVGKPRVLIADEPTAGMDEEMRNHFYQQLKHAIDEGLAVLLITHSKEEREILAHRIVWLRDGVAI